MRWSVTSHPQGFKTTRDRNKCVQMMKAAGFQNVRVSAMQHPVISANNARDLHMILDAGMGLVVVVQATDGYLTLTEKEWAAYCYNVVRWLPIGTPGQTKVQPGNEMNTEFGTGKGIRPSIQKAIAYYRIAADIILSKFPGMYLISGGVTNEGKTDVKKGKISARTFLEAFIGADPPLPISAFGYHFYYDRPDKPKDLALLKSNLAYLQKYGGGRPVILTETGAADPMNALKWYGMLMRGELKGIEDAGWYCMDHHKAAGADFQLVDNALNPSPLYQRMVEDATLGVGR